MISYKPFQKLLIDKQITPTDLIKELGLSSATIAKLNAKKRKSEYVSLSVIEKICIYFNCPISDIIEIRQPIQSKGRATNE